jgi:hypothetical protein
MGQRSPDTKMQAHVDLGTGHWLVRCGIGECKVRLVIESRVGACFYMMLHWRFVHRSRARAPYLWFLNT